MPTLAEVNARHSASADVTVEEHRLAWPTMRDALQVIRKLRSGVAAEGGSVELESLLLATWTWTSDLTNSLKCPRDAGTADLWVATSRLLASGRDSRFNEELTRLAAILERLETEPHPATSVLEGLVSRYGRLRPDDAPAVYIAAGRRHTGTIEAWLSNEDLDAEVRTVSELRDTDVRDALILLGPPAHYLMSPWCPPARAAQIGSWLLNAPPARVVHIVSWPGHPGLNARPLLPGSPAQTITRPEPGPSERVAGSGDEIIWLPPVPVESRIFVRSSPHDRDPVPAVGFRLAGDMVAFYSSFAGPRPELVTFDLDTVQIGHVDPARVSIGRALLFRPERSAIDAELLRRADELLVSRRGAGAPAAAQAAKRELKDALRHSRKDHDQLVDDLAARVGDRHYATYILSRIDDLDYIAPEKPGAYDAVRAALGLPHDDGGRQRGLLASLRGALRRSGIAITAELVAALKNSVGWQDELATTGEATIAGGEFLGHLDLRVVTAVDPEPKSLGRSRLGRLLPTDGRR